MTGKKKTMPRRPNIPKAAPPAGDAALDAWVNGAPDGKKAAQAEPEPPPGFVTVPRELLMQRNRQISLRLPNELVERVDNVAASQGISRSDYILRAITAQVQGDGG